MRFSLPLVFCVFAMCGGSASAQTAKLQPMHAPAGSVLTFYLQTRLSPGTSGSLDALPKGTTLQVKLLDGVDSATDRDGAAFRGVVVSPVLSPGNEVVIPANAEVHGLFALLRSRNHPEGFRYELLLTKVIANGSAQTLTAALDASLSDSAAAPKQADGSSSLASQPVSTVQASAHKTKH